MFTLTLIFPFYLLLSIFSSFFFSFRAHRAREKCFLKFCRQQQYVVVTRKDVIISWYEEIRRAREKEFLWLLLSEYISTHDYPRPFGSLHDSINIVLHFPPFPTIAWALPYWYFMALNYFMKMCQKWDELCKWRDFCFFASSA